MRWLLALLLVAMPVVAQAPSGLVVDIEESTFSYGPEDWKTGYDVDDAPSLAVRGTDWSATLGARLDLHIKAVPASGNAGNDWDYQAWLTDGLVEVEGLVTPDPAGRFMARFDIDGQRALPGVDAIPALVPGTWTLRVRATTEDASGNTVPEGSGQARMETSALFADSPRRGEQAVDAIQVPASLLPRIDAVGPMEVWLNRAAIPSGTTIHFQAEGTQLVWRAWWPEGLGTDPTWTSRDIGDGDGASTAMLSTTPGTEQLFIITVIDPIGGGHHVWALGVSDDATRVTSVTAPRPGESGAVLFDLATPSRAALNLAPGTLHAIGMEAEATLIASSPLIPTDQTHVRAILDAGATRAHGGPYRTVTILESGGAYAGHITFDRGLAMELDVPTLGEGTVGEMHVYLRSLSSDGRSEPNPALQTRATLDLEAAGSTTSTSFEVLEAGSLSLPFTFTPATAGSVTITALLDTGDTVTRLDQVEPVLDAQEYENADKPWYDPGKYIPGPPVAILLVALALLGRKR